MKEVILAIRLRQLGDIISTLQALKSIKESDSEVVLLFMIDEHYHELFSSVEHIDELVPPPPRVGRPESIELFLHYIEDLRGRRISCVLDFHSNPRSALISFLSGAPRRIGYDVRIRKVFYTEVEQRAKWRNGKKLPWTSQDSALDLAARFLPSIRYTETPPEIPVPQESYDRTAGFFQDLDGEGEFVGLNPGNPYPAKAWPEENFVSLASMLIAGGKRVVVMCGPGEERRANAIKEAIGKGACISPILSLSDLAGFLKHLSLLITIDSGLKHLAVALRLPTLTLFGPTSPLEWHIGTENDEYIYLGYSCSPCRLLDCPFRSPCMSRISPGQVFDKAESILDKRDKEVVC